MIAEHSGKFIVSLDFEIMWGVRDVVTVQTYSEHLRGVHQAVPKILAYFKKHEVKGTFATVALLFFETKGELLNNLPAKQPAYKNGQLSPYGDYITNNVGIDAQADPYHFAPHLVQLIKKTPGQEIGTHTFSHFYCLEEGQGVDDFVQDIKAAIDTAGKYGVRPTSIVFPRNQINPDYLAVCADSGLTNYRGNENSWIYDPRTGQNESLLRRSCRLVDAYINLSGYHCYTDEFMSKGRLINIPSSRFLRPYSFRLRFFEKLKLKRITESMTYAAKNGLLYHLWWHPHNFGINQEQNFSFLEKILEHYHYLNKLYGFKSYTMSEYASILSAARIASLAENKIKNRNIKLKPQ